MSLERSQSSPYAFLAFLQLYLRFHDVKIAGKNLDHHDVFKLITKLGFSNYEHFDPKSLVSLFITWKKKSFRVLDGDNYDLRGCIGTFAKLPLVSAIERYSLLAAIEDSRFPPISEKELANLSCSCNILQGFKTIYDKKSEGGDINDWEIGKHGIELKFQDSKHRRTFSATFLPKVMTEQGWNKEETFLNLIVKSGCSENANQVLKNYKSCFVQVIRYSGYETSIDYDEFASKLALFEK